MFELIWAIDDAAGERLFVQSLKPTLNGRFPENEAATAAMRGESTELYRKAGDLALINVSGPLTKGQDVFSRFFGGSSTMFLRDAVNAAADDKSVSGILLRVDSPGGSVAGTGDLAEAVFRARQKKVVHAFIEDMGASAAYWIASQSDRVTANPTAMVGSIGTYLLLRDFSKLLEGEGIITHVVRAGKFKGAGALGARVTDEQLADFQRITDDINEHFLSAVARGRNLGMDQVRKLADGRVHIGAHAISLGLIDAVGSFESAIQTLHQAAPRGVVVPGSSLSSTTTPPKETTNMKFNKHQMGLMASWGLAVTASDEDVKKFYNALSATQKELVDALKSSADTAAAGSQPTDAATGATQSASGQSATATLPTTASTSQTPETRTQQSSTAPNGSIDVDTAVNAALERDQLRRNGINALCDQWKSRGFEGIDELRSQMVNDRACTIESATKKVLEYIGQNQSVAVSNLAGLSVGQSAREKFVQVADNALLLHAGIESDYVYNPQTRRARRDPDAAKKHRLEAEQSGLAALSLQSLARQCLQMNGRRDVLNLNSDQLFEAVSAGAFGMSSSDFPLILEASAHKILQQAYDAAETTFQEWCDEGSVKDFNTHKKLRLSESPLLQKRPEGAPARHGYFSEERETFSVDDWALAIGLTRKMMVNDDLQAFVDLTTALGEGVKLTIEYEVWNGTMALNAFTGPTMGDGVVMFHAASHGNLAGSGAAPSQDTIKAGIISMGKQTGFGQDGAKIAIGNMPKYFLGSMTDALLAEEIISAQHANDDNRNSPQHKMIRQLVPISVPYLTLNDERDWYLTGPKGRSPVQVSYLNGNKNPRLIRVDGTTVAGIQWVTSLDVGVDGVDWRRAYRDPGA